MPGLRAYAWMPDTFNPPGLVVGQPDLAYEGVQRTFCTAAWSFPLFLAVARTSDRAAQDTLFGFVDQVVDAITSDPTLGGAARTTTVTTATPAVHTSPAGELPGYTITCDVMA